MKELTSFESLEDCLTVSAQRPIFIFKHSTACPISAQAHHEVTQFLSNPCPDCPETHMVKVIENRHISKQVANRLSLQHASPQLILVKKGQAVWAASHWDITAQAMEQAIGEHADTSG